MDSNIRHDASGFHTVLAAPGRAADIPAEDDVYGWLVGSWELEVLRYRIDVRAQKVRAEAHFGWTLEGRAVQDVWLMPARGTSTAPVASGVALHMYGTTLRVWDAALRAWRITFLNPATGQRDEMIGRRVGDAIVQIGTHVDGTPIRWTFTELTPDSFHWTGSALAADGVTWNVEGEFLARRMTPQRLR
ncbi:hypothetical protein [Paraburkholderia phosphatilytica]|uniref:hypothetical protein n=1 Tax=Paraburkholderia phosphatilytica TaxID=2282883 RepID=UPI000E499153|nr:hypothetical protein [Paraburkholderia phosphatilytica]